MGLKHTRKTCRSWHMCVRYIIRLNTVAAEEINEIREMLERWAAGRSRWADRRKPPCSDCHGMKADAIDGRRSSNRSARPLGSNAMPRACVLAFWASVERLDGAAERVRSGPISTPVYGPSGLAHSKFQRHIPAQDNDIGLPQGSKFLLPGKVVNARSTQVK